LKKETGSGNELGSILLFEELKAEAFFIKHRAEMWKQKLEAVKFLWKPKQTRKRLILYGAGSGSKNNLLLLHP